MGSTKSAILLLFDTYVRYLGIEPVIRWSPQFQVPYYCFLILKARESNLWPRAPDTAHCVTAKLKYEICFE